MIHYHFNGKDLYLPDAAADLIKRLETVEGLLNRQHVETQRLAASMAIQAYKQDSWKYVERSYFDEKCNELREARDAWREKLHAAEKALAAQQPSKLTWAERFSGVRAARQKEGGR